MSLIEQAAKRLEQLKQAGVEISEPSTFNESIETNDLIAQDSYPRNIQPASSSSQTRESDKRNNSAPSIMLDLDEIAAAGILVPTAARSQLADELRVIKRPLIANAMKVATSISNGNLIMITSALPGEGKSFTAINLAISIAMELDNTVMLVDADVARPSVLRMLGMPPAKGLLDVLQKNSVDISDVLMRTNIEKLSILPSGTPHPRATELLASDTMVRLLNDMAGRYNDRIIIFDSPPLLLTTEARVLATHMGQVVMVVNAEHTAQAAVKEAIATIEACPMKMMLLNQVRAHSSEAYGYGYGYGYGHES